MAGPDRLRPAPGLGAAGGAHFRTVAGFPLRAATDAVPYSARSPPVAEFVGNIVEARVRRPRRRTRRRGHRARANRPAEQAFRRNAAPPHGQYPVSGTALATPYLDTDADQLSFTLGRPAHKALAVRDFTVGGHDVQLRLLGASHQVFAGPVRETVACLPGVAGGLPEAAAEEFDDWDYRFSARVRHFAPARFSEEVTRIRRLSDESPRALYGIFPGSVEAVTALIVERRGTGLGWRTWHTYPQSRQIVATCTRLEAR